MSSALIDLPIFGPKKYERLKGKPTVYTDTFERCEPSDRALLRVTNGDGKKTRIKSGRIYVNGTKVAKESDFKKKVPYFEKIISIQEQNELKIVIKSGHHGYLDKLSKYQAKKAGLEQELDRLRCLKDELTALAPHLNPLPSGERNSNLSPLPSGERAGVRGDSEPAPEGSNRGFSVAKIELLLKELHAVKKSHDERESFLDRIDRSLDDDAEGEDEDDSVSDDEPELESGWISDHRDKLGEYRKEMENSIKECEKARNVLDKTPKKNRDKDHEKKDQTLKDLIKLLKYLDHAIEKAQDRLEDIEEKIEKIKKKGPSFIIIEIIGKDCDDTAPVVSNPSPPDGALLNTDTPTISAQYADEYKGSGIVTDTVKITMDGSDVTSDSDVTPTGVTYTPSSKLSEGEHEVTVSVSDKAHNPATLTWHFTTDTIAPVPKITSHQNGQYLKAQPISVSGTLDDSTAVVTVNGRPAENTGTGFTLASLGLVEGQNNIEVIATDPAGNSGRYGITVTLDTVAPAISVTTPQPEEFVKTPKITVSGTVTELHHSGLWVNGTPVQLTDGSFSLSGVSLTEGQNTVSVRALDLAANETLLTVPVTLDTVLPVVTITAPSNNHLTNNPQITITGTVNEPIISLTINDAPASFTGQSFNITYTLTEGKNKLTVATLDRASNPGSASVYVTLDTIAPDAPVIEQPTTPTKVNQTTITGTAEAGSTVNIYATTAESGATQLIGTLIADSEGAFTLPNVILTEGENTFTATATDPAGNTSIESTPVTVVLDTKLPVITVTAPANNTYTNQSSVTVTGTVDEQATVTINGTEVPLDDLKFTHIQTLTTGINSIVVTATDLAGNPSTKTVFVHLDQTDPVVTITTPMDGLYTNTQHIPVTGTVNETVTSVMVGNIPAVISGSSFSVASYPLEEGINRIEAVATDRAGNVGKKSVDVTLDRQMPEVSLTAPAQAAAGANVSISISATDNRGLSLSELRVNGATVWSSTLNSELSTQNSILYSASPDLAQNTVLTVHASALDIAGNTGTATTQIQIVGAPTGNGYIQGEAYDDTKGLRIEGATADILDADARRLTQITTEDGTYFSELAAGTYLVSLSKEGFTTVERTVTVKPEKNTMAIDARLTPISQTQNLINTNGGTAKTSLDADERGSSQIELNIPAGAVNEQMDIRITPISNQGLAGLFPAGWSPIAVIDIRAFTPNSELGTLNFSLPATLKVPVLSGLNLEPSSQITVVRYDKTTHQWIVQAAGTVSSDGSAVIASVPSTGQYAFVLSDSGSTTTTPPASPLSPDGSTTSTLYSSLTATGRVVPPAAPPSVGLKAVGEVVLTPNASPLTPDGFLSSGIIITALVTERFDLFSGDVVLPSEYTQDLILYRYPCVTNLTLNSELSTLNSGKVGTTFPVTPSREYTIVDLMLGKVGIEVSLREAEENGVMVGTDGARLLDTEGNVLVIPEGALPQTVTVPVETKTVAPSSLTGVVGSDFTLLRAVEVNLTGRTLSSSAELSIPAPSGLNTSLPIIVAKAIEVKGAKKLKLVALARISGSLITSYVPSAPSAFSAVKGVVSSGTYLFIQAKASLGFVTGSVTDASGNPFPSALVTSSTCSLVDLTGADGKYLIASTVTGFTATATDTYKNNQATSTGTITSSGQTVTIDLTIQITPPRVVSVTFNPEATDTTKVEPNAAIIITFTEAVKKETVTSANIFLKDADDQTIKGIFSINPDATIVTFYPSTNLKSETLHTLNIIGSRAEGQNDSIQDLHDNRMGIDVTSQFTIRDTTPPPMPPAGRITATFPDANGIVTVAATQGSVEANCTVLIINDTTGEIVAVQAGTDGSFSEKIHAQLGDEIKIVMMDDAGNQTLITYITFKSDDGKYLVTAKGGTVTDDESGAKLEIPEGALYGPTVIKITPVTEDQLPQDNPVPQQAKFLAAVNIDTGGMNFQKEVKLSVPKPPDMPADAMPFVAQPAVHTNADGTKENVYVIYDSAKIIDDRVTTASKPFPGIMGFGIFTFLFEDPMARYPVVFSGYTYRNMDGHHGYNPQVDENNSTQNNIVYLPGSDLPISGAVVRCVGAENFISYSNSKGHYATYGFTAPDVCRSFDTTAIHPQTMNRVTAKLEICDAPFIRNDFNYQLADKDTEIPDITPPTINMNMSVVPGQDGNPQFVAGTIPTGTEIELTPFNVIDQKMGSAQLVVSFQTPTMPNPDCYSVQADPLSNAYHDTMMDQHNQPVILKKYLYKPNFDTAFPASCSPNGAYTLNTGAGLPLVGNWFQYFRPAAEGTYKFTLYAKDAAGNNSAKTIQVRAVIPGEVPISGTEGPPTVDEIVPVDGAKDTMVTLSVKVTMSEPVKEDTINENTLKLLDHGPISSLTATPKNVPALLTTAIEGGRVKAVLTPKSNLMFSHKYEVVINDVYPDQRIQDKFTNNSGENLPMQQVYSSVFYTKVPQVYDLPPLEQGEDPWSGRDIALYTDPDGRTLTYVTADADGYYIVDVTDPTKPVITGGEDRRNAGVSWRYKGVAVEQEQKLLAMTEDIFYYGTGNQYGYIRFYDLSNIPPNPAMPSQYSNDPGDPNIVGREQLAFAYSGIPMRLALLGDYAYVATVNLGLQVVDIKKAKEMAEQGKRSDGSTIVGIFDTVGLSCKDPDDTTVKFCGQPMDISAYRNSSFPVGLLATRSGHLAVLDLSIPQDTTIPPLPRLIEAFKPSGYSAWRIAVAPEYTYTPSPLEGEGGGEGSAGGTQVIDLAVTAGHNRKINTVDLTDPYKPTVMGVTKDSDGNEVTAVVSDIAISKTSGLAYATAGSSVYVIDIKDPYNPKLLNIITEVPVNCPPTSDNCNPTAALGTSTGLVEKDGWVYLANQQYGMRALDLDPPEIGIEEDDKEFPPMSLLAKDYYPALGTKAFRIWGVVSDTKTPLDSNWELCLTQNIQNFKIGLTLAQNGDPVALDATSPANNCGGSFTIDTNRQGDRKGYITLYVKWSPVSASTGTTPTMPEQIQLKILARRNDQTTLVPSESNPNITKLCDNCSITIRHNGKTTFEDVLNGKAVYIYGDGVVSKSTGTTTTAMQKLDYVQELLNQVVPRKRKFKSGNNLIANSYSVIAENGIYGLAMEKAVKTYREQFGSETGLSYNEVFMNYTRIGNTRVNFTTDPTTGKVEYNNDFDPDEPGPWPNDNTTDTFRKLMKDYNHRTVTKSKTYLHRVIDKETLVGAKERIPNWLEGFFIEADTMPNSMGVRRDTGLYEFYRNVVVRYVDAMIKEAERYAGKKNSIFDDVPTSNWTSRNGKGPAEDAVQEGYDSRGMSYSFGGKMSVKQFNETQQVSPKCYAKPTESKKVITVDFAPGSSTGTMTVKEIASPAFVTSGPDSIPGVSSDYEGDLLLEPTGYEENGYPICETGSGMNKYTYAGLRRHERNASEPQNLIAYAQNDELILPEPPITTTILHQFNPAKWAGIDCSGLTQRALTKADKLNLTGTSSGLDDLGEGACPVGSESCLPCGSQSYMPKYAQKMVDMGADLQVKLPKLKAVRRGDLVVYDGHVATVYSDKLQCNNQANCTYEIIHASGINCLDIDGSGACDDGEPFNRKIVVNSTQYFKTNPTGFGRIKLWD